MGINKIATLLIAIRILCTELGTRRGKEVQKRAIVHTTLFVHTQASLLVHTQATLCTQLLRIQFFLDFDNVLTHMWILVNLALDLLDRVNCGGVVFAAKFVGNLRKTKMQFAA